MIQQTVSEQTAKVGDAITFVAAVSVVAGWLPVAVGLATLLWTVLRIYEMETTQRLIRWVKSKFAKAE